MAIFSNIRKSISTIVEVITVLLLLIAIVFFVINQQSAIATKDRFCHIKAAFGLYIVALCTQVVLVKVDCACVIIVSRRYGLFSCRSYDLKVYLHIISAMAIFIGIIVEGSGGIKVWQFYLCLIAGILSGTNGIVWYISERRRRQRELKDAIKEASNITEEAGQVATGKVQEAGSKSSIPIFYNRLNESGTNDLRF